MISLAFLSPRSWNSLKIRLLMASDGVDPSWLWKFLLGIATRQVRSCQEWLSQERLSLEEGI